jgi:hypothetical protein
MKGDGGRGERKEAAAKIRGQFIDFPKQKQNKNPNSLGMNFHTNQSHCKASYKTANGIINCVYLIYLH